MKRGTVALLLGVTICLARSWALLDSNTIIETEAETVTDSLDTTPTIGLNESLTTSSPNHQAVEKYEFPADCSQREKSKSQPIFSPTARLKKCCPLGEGLSFFGDNESQQLCDSTDFKFKPSILNVELYDNCIEDTEEPVILPLEIGNPCNMSLLYNNTDDMLYVLQDGSLLIMDIFANQSYAIEKVYCIDIDNVSEKVYAFICITSVEEHLKRSQIMLVAILMLISIPCLLTVSYLHIALRELRTLHGLSLSLMSSCLATGYFLHSIAHIYNINSMAIGYAVQYFLLTFYFWYLLLCCNITLNIWISIPLNKRISKTTRWCTFCIYCLIAFSFPILLVVLTIQKGLPGMPSYFIQGFTESIRESQRYFIPPVSSVLFLSFITMTVAFFGFQRIKKRTTVSKAKECRFYLSVSAEIDEERYEAVKKDAKCISFLGVIMIITWLLEIVTFYSPGDDNYLIVLEMINGLQGVFILLIFLVVRRRRTIIFRWWYDRGSHNVEQIEEELSAMPLNK